MAAGDGCGLIHGAVPFSNGKFTPECPVHSKSGHPDLCALDGSFQEIPKKAQMVGGVLRINMDRPVLATP